MAKKKRWFMLGLLGTLTGVILKLVRGRKADEVQAGRWEDYTPPKPPESGEAT